MIIACKCGALFTALQRKNGPVKAWFYIQAMSLPNPDMLERATDRAEAERTLVVDPLECANWNSLVSLYTERSFFHGARWARVLRETYGHRPVYFCRFLNGVISGMLPVMEVPGLLAGRKGVSLPFTDFCAPLQSSDKEAEALFGSAMQYGCRRGWRFLECRCPGRGWSGATQSVAFWGHTINLEGGPTVLFKTFKSPVRCAIRKAERQGVQIEVGSGLDSMRAFYSLHCLTRRRHGMPCQPFRFFENIVRFVMNEGHGFIIRALWRGATVAAAIFFQEGREAIYKFGASDYTFQNLRPNNLLMWEAMKKCAASGSSRLHLGRTSLTQPGLRRFKLGFGAVEDRIEYCKYHFGKQAFVKETDFSKSFLNYVFKYSPLPFFRVAGRFVYARMS